MNILQSIFSVKNEYRDIFKSSDVMITDCMSFLAEYFPSEHPLTRLVNLKSPIYNSLGDLILSPYYNVYDNEMLEKTFLDVVINKNDIKRRNIYLMIIRRKDLYA